MFLHIKFKLFITNLYWLFVWAFKLIKLWGLTKINFKIAWWSILFIFRYKLISPIVTSKHHLLRYIWRWIECPLRSARWQCSRSSLWISFYWFWLNSHLAWAYMHQANQCLAIMATTLWHLQNFLSIFL